MLNRYCLIILSLLFALVGQSQDTLFFKDKQKSVVLVKEVSQTEIQYKKIDLSEGPMYIISKNDIEKIIYKNGYVDVFKNQPAPVPEQSFTVVYNNVANINTEKITYSDTKKRYGSLVSLIDRHPDPSRKEQLTHSASELRSLKRHENGTRTGAIIFGGVTIAGALLYSAISSTNNLGYVDPIFAAPPVVFGVLGVALGAASIAINVNLRKKRHAFVNLYNQ